MKTTIRNERQHLESYPCLTFVWKTLLFWKLLQHKREGPFCLTPHDPSISCFAGEKHVLRHQSFPAHALFYLTCLLFWWCQCLCWHSSLLCFWPHRGDRTRTKWVNPELGGLLWKKIHHSFITFCLKHKGRIRHYIFILMSWDMGAFLETYARPWIQSESILWCACTSSIFLWFSLLDLVLLI